MNQSDEMNRGNPGLLVEATASQFDVALPNVTKL
jgi:hypothetical protein